MKNTQIYGKRERKIKIKRKYFREKDKKNVFKKKEKKMILIFVEGLKFLGKKTRFVEKKFFLIFQLSN